MAARSPAKRQKSVTAVADLEQESDLTLRARWTKLFGRPPPPKLNRGLLILAIAYQLQERAVGELSGHTRRRLISIANDDLNPATQASPQVALKAGMQLLREWRGDAHRVQVIEKGFEYQGTRYKSLSQIARQITGTQWSGPAFFGLKSRKRDSKELHHGEV